MCKVNIRIDDREDGQTYELEKELQVLRTHHGDFFEIVCEGKGVTVYQLDRARAISEFVALHLKEWLGLDDSAENSSA